MRGKISGLLAALAVLGAASAARADDMAMGPAGLVGNDATMLDLAAGSSAGLGGHKEFETYGGRAELRFGDKFWYIGPAVGVVANARGGFAGYAGGYADIRLGQIMATPLLAVSGWSRGGKTDINLGGPVEFRSEITISYRLPYDMRIGVMVAHMSNAGLYHLNPGENEIMASFAFPLRF